MTLDTTITQELKEEGMAREVIRAIQDMRRELGMKPGEKIRAYLAPSDFLDRWRRHIAQETGIGAFASKEGDTFPVRREVAFENETLQIGIDKIK